jgi:hypothetical protein
MSSKFDYRKYKHYDEQSFEGHQHPIYMRPANEAYRVGWERIFNRKGVENAIQERRAEAVGAQSIRDKGIRGCGSEGMGQGKQREEAA